MNILHINTHLFKGGGPRSYMQQAIQMQRVYGHTVHRFGMAGPDADGSDPDAKYYLSPMDLVSVAGSSSLKERLGGAARAFWSRDAARRLGWMLDDYDFDIVHLHNIRYQISPSILPVLKRAGLPVVQTLHDYSMLCPRGTLYTENNGICEKCRLFKYYHAPLTRCIKGSATRSLFAATELAIHRSSHVFDRNIDLYISPSRFNRDKHIDYGFSPERISLLYNAVDVSNFDDVFGLKELDYAVYVGALRRLKGVHTLLDAAARLPQLRLLFIGEGEEYAPLQQAIIDRNLTNVSLTGHMSGPAFRRMVAQARFTVIPSELYENCPMVALEAFAMGKPVIGARIGGIPELVEDHVTGLLFEPGNVDDLVKKISFLNENSDLRHRLGRRARQRVEQKYGIEKHYTGLMAAYEKTIKNNARSY